MEELDGLDKLLVMTMLVSTNMIMKTMNKELQWPEDYQNWSGTFEDLVSAAGDILARIDPKAGVPTASLVRYYQQQGAVGRGQKKGRSSEFGYDDLARVVATKLMANQQVPLSISKEMLAYTSVDTIVRNAGIPDETLYASPAVATSVALSNQAGNQAELTVAKLLASASYGDTPMENMRGSAHSYMSLTGSLPSPTRAMNAAVVQAAAPQPALPPGGVLRYTLAGNVVVEIPADGNQRTIQADALRTFADQIDPPSQSPTRSSK